MIESIRALQAAAVAETAERGPAFRANRIIDRTPRAISCAASGVGVGPSNPMTTKRAARESASSMDPQGWNWRTASGETDERRAVSGETSRWFARASRIYNCLRYLLEAPGLLSLPSFAHWLCSCSSWPWGLGAVCARLRRCYHPQYQGGSWWICPHGCPKLTQNVPEARRAPSLP